jgi:RNA polymerase sigma factor (sigma-70 family)
MSATEVETDLQLLQRYTRERAEDAFAEIVRRHLDLVHSAALRQVRSPQLAEETAQSVFTDLARNAQRLAPETILTAWLYQVTRRTAIDVVRREARRQLREQIATEMNAMNASAAEWTHIEPLLDEAMSALDETDRAAVLLRYFENKSLRDVGQQLGVSDDAAQKRVSRAVERLREFFAKRGVAVGASGLVAIVSVNAVQAAPVGLAVTISTATVLSGTTIAAAATATATQTIAMTTLQKTLLAVTVGAACVATPVLIQHQAQVKLRDENASLRQQVEQLSALVAENERLSNLAAQISPALSKDQLNDLVRLRNEVGTLRRQTNELLKLREENRRLQTAQGKRTQPLPTISASGELESPDIAAEMEFPREAWAFAGYTNPENAVVSLASAALAGDLATFLNSLTPEFQAKQWEKWKGDGKNETQIRDNLVKEFGRTETIRILNRENISENEIVLSLLIDNGGGHRETPRMRVQRIGDEWKMAGPYQPPAQKEP